MDARRRARIDGLYLGVAVLLVLAAFGGHLGGEYVWDDAHIVRDNRSLDDLEGLGRNFVQDTWQASGARSGQFYRPVLMLSFWVQRQLGADSVAAYRGLSVVLQIVCGYLLLLMLRRFEVRAILALPLAWLFLVHPVVTEPVMSLASRQEIIAVAFSLASLLVWPKVGAPRASLRVVASCLFMLAAFFTKEGYVVVPLLLVATQLVWRGRHVERRDVILWVAPVATIALGFVWRAVLGIGSSSALLARPLLEHVRGLATEVHHFGSLIVGLENGLTFAAYEPLSPWAAALVWLGLLAVGLPPFVRWLRAPEPKPALGAAWVGLTWFVLALAPVVLVVPILGIQQNRYAYFPLVGLMIGLGGGLEMLASWLDRREVRGRVLRTTAGLALLLVGALCVARTRVEASAWQSNLALYGSDVERAPNNGVALYHYATAVRERAGCERALPLFSRAAALAPDYPRAFHNTAGCLIELGRYAEALEPAQRAFQLTPDHPGAAHNLGVGLLGSGRRDEARRMLERALDLDPGHEAARDLLEQMGAPR